MRRIAAWMGLLLALPPSPASSAVFSVGSGGTCTHATLASAVAAAAANGPNLDAIRIANSLSFAGPIDVSEQSLAIYGTTACDNDVRVQRDLEITSGDGFRMLGGVSSLRTLDLADLSIIMTAGRTLAIQNRSYVILEANALLSNGSAVDGGNVSMSGPDATLAIFTGARVSSGDATGNGGGIHCSGGGTIELIEGSVEGNHAAGDGGGLYLDGCTLNDAAGVASGLSRGGIYDNRAEGSGGGIYATNGSDLSLSGSAEVPVVIRDNRAQDGAGGGIAVTGASTTVDAQNTRIYDNIATSAGGVDVRNGASFTMERVGSDCVEPLECSTISGNVLFARIAAGGHGGAISVTAGGRAEIFQTYIARNDADDDGGVAYVDGASSLRIEGSMLWGNGVGSFRNLLRVSGGSQLLMGFSTTASNLASGDTLADVTDTGSSAAFHANVLGESAGGLVQITGGSTSPGSCNVVPLGPVPPAWTGTIYTSPGALFDDLGQGDLHLRPSAPIFDTCSTSGYAPLRPDFDDEPRGFDQVSIEDGLGTYDAGADEYLPEPEAAACAAVAVLSLLAARRRIRSRVS